MIGEKMLTLLPMKVSDSSFLFFKLKTHLTFESPFMKLVCCLFCLFVVFCFMTCVIGFSHQNMPDSR